MRAQTVSSFMLALLFLSLLLPSLGTNSAKGTASRYIGITNSATGLNSITIGNSTQQLPLGGVPFALNVSLNGSTSDLAAWQVGISFDNNSFRCTDLSIPESDPSYVFHGKPEIMSVDFSNDTQSGKYTGKPQVVAGGALLDPGNAVTVDSALLCVMNFTAFKVGERSRMTISFLPNKPSAETFLLDSNNFDIASETEAFFVNLLEGTIVPDIYSTIQAAINGANSGDSILVRRGTYHENVVVNKTVALIGEDRANTAIDGSGAGYVVGIKGANNVSVCNFTIQNGQTGVYVGDWGALIESSRGNVINNVIRSNVDYGVFVDQSNYTVSGNVIENNGIGLNILSNGAINGVFRGNDVRNNSRYNLDLNSAVYDFLDMDTTNLVDSKPVYFWLRRLDETVPSNAGQVTLVNCSNILVQGLDLGKNSVNVQFVKSYNCTFQGSNLSSADVGVLLVDSRNCNVSNNTLSDCRIDLQVQGSMNNTFTGNYLWINDFCGIDFGSTANNSFYHNTLNNLGATYIVYRAGLNIWDNGYPSGGNFWSDYVGVDLKRGPNQDINGSDQIGDTPYIIDANNSDHYPLVAARSPTSVHNVDSGLDYESIQSAIDAQETLNGHTILVDAGTYYEDLTLSKSVSLVGEGSINTIIDGSSSGAVINITASSVNLTGFTITNSGAGYPSGGVLVYSSNNTISHNRIESNNGSGIYLFATSYGNNISNNEVLNNTGTGIYILSSSNTLTGNEIAGNHYYGLSLHSANNNTITDNGIVANGQYGISLRSSCENILQNNDILDNDEGIFMWFSSCNNTLAENKIVGNSFHGVWLDFSSGNILEGNDISGNGGGLWLQYSSSSNSLIENNITDNHDLGLGLDTSSYNIIYHNNFMNSVNVVATQGLVNIWDNGYPAGGNYWNGFTGNDSGSGLFQNETGSDGVIDIANIIDVNNRDLFPLTKPYSNQFDIGITQIEVSEHRMGHLRLPVSAKIINYGEQTESFNVSLMANSTRMQTQTIMVPSRNSTIVMFVWNVTKAARGNYSIAVIASSLQGETDTRDNELAMEALFFVTAPGDVAGPANVSDGIVNMDDLAAIVMKFNARAASSRWNVDLDVNDDGVINMRDISIAILNLDRP